MSDLVEKRSGIRVPTGQHAQAILWERIKKHLRKQWGRSPSPEEIQTEWVQWLRAKLRRELQREPLEAEVQKRLPPAFYPVEKFVKKMDFMVQSMNIFLWIYWDEQTKERWSYLETKLTKKKTSRKDRVIKILHDERETSLSEKEKSFLWFRVASREEVFHQLQKALVPCFERERFERLTVFFRGRGKRPYNYNPRTDDKKINRILSSEIVNEASADEALSSLARAVGATKEEEERFFRQKRLFLSQVGVLFGGVSGARAEQIFKRAIRKLKIRLEELETLDRDQ